MQVHQLHDDKDVSKETNADWMERRNNAVPKGVGHACPIFADRAENSEVWDVEGSRYIDFAGGIAVMNTGHVHPKITAAVQKQTELFSHTAFQVMPYRPYIELAERLNELAPGPTVKKTVFFTSGAEAVENSVKIARSFTGRPGIITFVGGYHGRSMMTLAMTGKVDPYKLGFGPFPSSVYHVPFPMKAHNVTTEDSINAIHNLFKADIEAKQVAAIVLEPVQGEGGFYQAPAELMTALREICDEHGILLIADEVQSGFGRTGKLFAMEHYEVEADMITTAKSLASGYPLSGVIGKTEIMDAPNPGGLGGTYGGNPVSCAAGLAVLEVMEEENLLARSTELGEIITARLNTIKAKEEINIIGDVRTLGAMTAFELVDHDGKPSPTLTKAMTTKALEKKLVLLSCGTFGNTIRILVPLTVSDDVLNEGLAIIEEVIHELN
ncbi:MAG: 4-aminobutyrate aminotransferase [Cocleimonas sp.]|jgi:4-aminobutyrate aminotransferase